MKRRLLSAFLAVMMVLTMAPMAFAADAEPTTEPTTEYVAQVDGNNYATIADAIAAANNKTLTLLKDVNGQIVIPEGKKITLDLNGHAISNGRTAVLNNGNLTICDSSEKKSGVIKSTGNVGIGVGDNSYTTIEYANIQSQEGAVITSYSTGATIIIKDGVFSAADNSVVAGNGSKRDGNANVITINGGTFIGNIQSSGFIACGIYAPWKDIITVNGGNFTVNNGIGIVARAGQVTVNGGTFTCTGSAKGGVGDKKFDMDAAQCVYFDASNPAYPAYNSETDYIKLQGGKFSSDVSAYVAKGYVQNENGTVEQLGETNAVAKVGNTYYKTLADAVEAANNGETVTLLKNVKTSGVDTAEARLVISKPITLDFNDKIIISPDNMGDNNTNFAALYVNANTTFKATTGGIDTGKNGGYAINVKNGAKLTIDGGKYYGGGTAVQVQEGELTINDGYFDAEAFGAPYGYNFIINCIDSAYKDGTAKVAIKGGYFAHFNPANNRAEGAGTNFVADSYISVTSDKSGYDYRVTEKTYTGNITVKPDVAEPEVTVSDSISKEDKQKVEKAAKTASAPTLGAVAGDKVAAINKTEAEGLVAKAQGLQNPTLYVQTALKVEPTAYNAENKTLTLDITPQYRIVASTAATADGIKLNGDNQNATVVQEYKSLDITKPIEVTMELPNGFVADGVNELSVKHIKHDGTVEYYTGKVVGGTNGTKAITFTTNGFSPFTISAVAAYVGTTAYPTLQEAANAANSGDTIVVKNGASHDLTFTATKSVKVKNDTGADITVKFNGENKPVAKDATETFSYTKPSSGGSSGGSSSGQTTYKVTTSAVNNGGVNASPSSAEKGASITITLSPDKGYKLDKLTVTDGSGKTVSTVKKSDTVYTFTMPASAVNVGVSYVKANATPSETKFNDVSANDWFASAVDYVTGKGMMNGTADNTFSPKANTTRGMVVTVLYRLENQPSTSAASFTDVASGAYYANAVAWANANGIVSGYGSGKFGPNDKVTREQLAAILYRYAQYKKYDVSGANSLDGYADAQSVSSYAVPALQWANVAGVVTGKSGSKLDPKGNAARAEVAAMLMRFCENVK